MDFRGYRRPDGKVGIRNHVLILPSVVCANRVARGISQQIAGTTWVEHQHGCTQLGADAELTSHVLVSHGTHPNVYGVVVVGLGCETIRAQDIAAAIKKQCPYKPVHTVIIQDEGGSVKATAAGASAARRMVAEASRAVQETLAASELILGTECGGSDACSGISANPSLGVATNMGVDMRGGQPTPGNIEGGLSSIEEKSLGCIYKAGSKPLQDVIEYAEPIHQKGLVWMDTPGQDVEQITGMVAGGCQLVVFTTGRGTCCGSPIAPTIKVSTTTKLFEKMNDNIDLDAGAIISGESTVQQVGETIFMEMLEVASGKLTKSEILGFNDFAIKRIGPSM